MTLSLEGLDVTCVIGDLPEERLRPQTLRLDIALDIPDRAGETDELSDTVDYAALAARIRAALAAARCRMIERAARLVADLCRADPRVRHVRVRVTKTGAVAHLAAASATYEGGRP